MEIQMFSQVWLITIIMTHYNDDSSNAYIHSQTNQMQK